MIVFDLDGTLRDVSCGDHLVPDDAGLTKNWLPWQDHVNAFGDTIAYGVLLYRLALGMGHKVIIATSSQHGTFDWLRRRDLPLPYMVFERDSNDNSAPVDYKKKIIKSLGGSIKMWIDDSAEVCDHVRSLGIEVIRVGGHQ